MPLAWPRNAKSSLVPLEDKANGYIVLTNDLDFGSTLAMTNVDKPSVIQLRVYDLDPLVLGTRVIRAIGKLRLDLRQGALVTVEDSRIRLRRLPFSRS